MSGFYISNMRSMVSCIIGHSYFYDLRMMGVKYWFSSVCEWLIHKQYAINGWLYIWSFVFLRFTNGED